MSKNIFGDDDKVDKIVFRPLNLDLTANVKKVSDPAPRPLPMPLDNGVEANDWIPGVKSRKRAKKPKEDSFDFSGIIYGLKMLLFSIFALGTLAGLGWLVLWMFEQYKIG